MRLRVFTHNDRPDLRQRRNEIESGAFPEFMAHNPLRKHVKPYYFGAFAKYQPYLYDEESDRLIGAAHTVPFFWDGSDADFPKGTQDSAFRAIDQYKAGIEPNFLCGVQGIIDTKLRGSGLSQMLIRALTDLAARSGLGFVSPIRPTLKERYPLIAMDRYARWTRADGQRFDPWLRIQDRIGGKFRSICEDSLVISGTPSEWESWTEMALPDSGEYVIPGGLVPLRIDREISSGIYSEPHVWYEYPIPSN